MTNVTDLSGPAGHLAPLISAAAHFGPGHVLADVAARNCTSHRPSAASVGPCGVCWEKAIRDDERFAVEYDLPREVTADPTYVDEIAVDLACAGEPVQLTAAEFAAAVTRLRARRLCPTQIARRLHRSYGAVARVTDIETKGVAA